MTTLARCGRCGLSARSEKVDRQPFGMYADLYRDGWRRVKARRYGPIPRAAGDLCPGCSQWFTDDTVSRLRGGRANITGEELWA